MRSYGGTSRCDDGAVSRSHVPVWRRCQGCALLPGTKFTDWDSGVGTIPRRAIPAPDEGNMRPTTAAIMHKRIRPKPARPVTPAASLAGRFWFAVRRRESAGAEALAHAALLRQSCRGQISSWLAAAARSLPARFFPHARHRALRDQRTALHRRESEPQLPDRAFHLHPARHRAARRLPRDEDHAVPNKTVLLCPGRSVLAIDADETLKGFRLRFAERAVASRPRASFYGNAARACRRNARKVRDGDPDKWWWKITSAPATTCAKTPTATSTPESLRARIPSPSTTACRRSAMPSTIPRPGSKVPTRSSAKRAARRSLSVISIPTTRACATSPPIPRPHSTIATSSASTACSGLGDER